jgi:hypothetical protein
MDGSKILSMFVENLHFLYLPKSLKTKHKSFDLTCKKGSYPHFFNMTNCLDSVESPPEPKYYGADFISGDE